MLHGKMSRMRGDIETSTTPVCSSHFAWRWGRWRKSWIKKTDFLFRLFLCNPFERTFFGCLLPHLFFLKEKKRLPTVQLLAVVLRKFRRAIRLVAIGARNVNQHGHRQSLERRPLLPPQQTSISVTSSIGSADFWKLCRELMLTHPSDRFDTFNQGAADKRNIP